MKEMLTSFFLIVLLLNCPLSLFLAELGDLRKIEDSKEYVLATLFPINHILRDNKWAIVRVIRKPLCVLTLPYTTAAIIAIFVIAIIHYVFYLITGKSLVKK